MSKLHNPKVIQLEFNELSPTLLDTFMAEGALPNFKRLYESSDVFHSEAEVPVEYLEPWIQWPTVHSGLRHDEHGIFHLGEGKKLEGRTVGNYLSDAGVRVGIFGSMNCGYEKVNGYVVPDPWDESGKAHPEFLSPFVDFVSRQVQESSRSEGFEVGELLQFGWFLARHGLSSDTAWSGVRQLFKEWGHSEKKWERAMVMEKICYDLFRYLNEKFLVEYATFFCNSTAHFQHYYWRHFEPERFSLPPTPEETATYSGAVLQGYQGLDKLVGRVLSDYPKSTILFCSALSQKPWVETTKCLFRVRDVEAFLSFAGLQARPLRVRPVMAQQFYFDFETKEQAAAAKVLLDELRVEEEPACWFNLEENSLFGGCSIEDAAALQKKIANASGECREFSDVFYQIHGMRSGRHDPVGALWIRHRTHRVHPESVPLTRIAPTVLAEFALPRPPAMTGEPLRC
ncbi:MAG: hypothetical protein KDD51_00560 [Bdellovibrionales bacterium]|nr:hypothetical protein [Bdellovibrionales bacterium]